MLSASDTIDTAENARADVHVEDAVLMQAWLSGEADAFDELHARYRERLWRYLRRSVADEDQARELYQDVWMRVIDRREDWQPTGRFVGWLFTIARHRMVDHYRSSARTPIVGSDADVDELLPDTSAAMVAAPLSPLRRAELAQDNSRVQQALSLLPEAQREAVLMHHVAGMTLDEIGQATGHKREAVKSRLRYGVNRLRQILGATS